MAPGQLTHEEIERMRQIVLQHDQTNRKGIQEFDLNKPPKEPYRHQEFPRMIYDHAKRRTKIVHNADHLADALAAGWKKEPFPAEVEEPELDAATAAEAAAIDRELRKPKKQKSE